MFTFEEILDLLGTCTSTSITLVYYVRYEIVNRQSLACFTKMVVHLNIVPIDAVDIGNSIAIACHGVVTDVVYYRWRRRKT